MMKNIYSTDDNLIKIAGIRLCLKYTVDESNEKSLYLSIILYIKIFNVSLVPSYTVKCSK